jgi:DNA-directed RNA polymerase specialized sigma24 family protein
VNRDERDAQFTDFVVGRLPHLRRIAYALTGDRHHAEDLLQTALAKLYIDDLRRSWRREWPTEVLPEHAADAAPSIEERSALFDALQALPQQQRKVVVLRHWLGLSVRETASELGISDGTVKSHSSRGLSALEALLVQERHD